MCKSLIMKIIPCNTIIIKNAQRVKMAETLCAGVPIMVKKCIIQPAWWPCLNKGRAFDSLIVTNFFLQKIFTKKILNDSQKHSICSYRKETTNYRTKNQETSTIKCRIQ